MKDKTIILYKCTECNTLLLEIQHSIVQYGSETLKLSEDFTTDYEVEHSEWSADSEGILATFCPECFYTELQETIVTREQARQIIRLHKAELLAGNTEHINHSGVLLTHPKLLEILL